MSFAEEQHPRETDGKFAAKTGGQPEVVLAVGRYIWTEEDHEFMLPSGRPSYDATARRNQAEASLEGLGTPLTNEYTLRDPLVIASERQGIAGVVLETRFGGDGDILDRHRIRLARVGANGVETGDFNVFTMNDETPTVRGSLRQVISNAPFLSENERAENSVSFEALYGEGDNAERYEALTSAAIVAADGDSDYARPQDIVPGSVIIAPTASEGRDPGIVNWTRDSQGGTEIHYLDGRTVEVADGDNVLVYG